MQLVHRSLFCSFEKLLNRMHRIVGYLKQQRIQKHLFLKLSRWRHFSRQACFPTSGVWSGSVFDILTHSVT